MVNPAFDYTSTQIVALVFAAVLLYAQHRRPLLLSHTKIIASTAILLVFLSLLYRSYLQWEVFSAGPPSSFLLPPYAPWTYFLQYCWSWFWSQYLLALCGAALLFTSIALAPANWRMDRFETHEPLLLAMGLFLVGHPYWIFYFSGVLLLYLAYTALRAWRAPTRQRVSFYRFWLPGALIVILLTPFLRSLPIMQVLTITL